MTQDTWNTIAGIADGLATFARLRVHQGGGNVPPDIMHSAVELARRLGAPIVADSTVEMNPLANPADLRRGAMSTLSADQRCEAGDTSARGYVFGATLVRPNLTGPAAEAVCVVLLDLARDERRRADRLENRAVRAETRVREMEAQVRYLMTPSRIQPIEVPPIGRAPLDATVAGRRQAP